MRDSPQDVHPVNSGPWIPKGADRLWAIGLGLLAFALQIANLIYVIHVGGLTGSDYSIGPDTPVYLRSADVMSGRGGTLDPMYRERVILPAMIAAVRMLGLGDRWALVLVSTSSIFAVLALYGAALRMSSGRRPAITAGLLYVAYPSLYQYGVLLETDVLHANFVIIAVAFLYGCIREGRGSYAAISGLAWMAAQLTRPNFLLVVVLLPYLIWQLRTRENWMRLCVGWACLVVAVPSFYTVAHGKHFGIYRPSLLTADMLYEWTLPKLEVYEANRREPQPMTPLFAEALQHVRETVEWQTLRNGTVGRDEFRSNYTNVMAISTAEIRRQIPELFQTSWNEFYLQLTSTLSYTAACQQPPLANHYPAVEPWIRKVQRLFALFLVFHFIRLFRTGPRQWITLALFLLVVTMGPASFSMWQGARYRMVFDLAALPVIAGALFSASAWICAGAVVLVGYVPHRLLGLPPWWLGGVTLVVVTLFAISQAGLWRQRRAVAS